ncbi:Glycosyl transferases group 1 [Mactra antiquata]
MATDTKGKNILLLSPLQPCSGNTATILRIRNGLEKNGMKCKVVDSTGILNHQEFTDNHGNTTYHLIIAVHAYKSGRLLLGTDIPYVIILGGTDVNQLYNEEDKMTVMSQAVHKSKHIVAFSSSVMNQFIKCWPDYNSSNISIIPQGVHVNPSSSFNLVQYLNEHNMLNQSFSSLHSNQIKNNDQIDLKELKIFSIVGAIRSVKNPTYILEQFSDWRERRELHNCWLLLLGSNFNDDYYTMFMETVERCPGVIYVPGLSSEHTHAVIKDSFSLINTSDSEGMALAILEEFIEKLDEVLENTDKVTTLIQNARDYITTSHCVDKEEQDYVDIIRKYT